MTAVTSERASGSGTPPEPARPARPRYPVPALLAWAVTAAAVGAVLAGAVAELTGSRAGLPAEGRDWLLAVLCVPLGIRVVTHAPRNACGWLLLATGSFAAGTVGTSIAAGGPAGWLRDWLWWPSFGLLLLAVLFFPDGRLISRRWRLLVALLVAAIGVGTVALAALSLRVPGVLLGEAAGTRQHGWEALLLAMALLALLVAAAGTVAAVALRLRRTPAGDRGPLIWAACNGGLLLVALLLDAAEGVPVVWLGATVAVPLAVTVGVVRYGLYDISLLVHRSLLYGLLTVAMLAVYAAAVAFAVRLVPSIAAPVAAGAAVMVLLPVRQGVQALLERLLYGHLARPYQLVTSLSRQIGSSDTPDRVLAAAVTAVGEGLKLPYVSIEFDLPRPATVHGRRRPWPVTTLPLSYQGRPIGSLLVQQRAPDEPWLRRERVLLDDLARQLGPSAAAVRLTHDLQDARERLVRRREEALRRLQRDLHDGIGPALSGARMLTRAARTGGPDRVDLLDDAESNLADAAVELRRIVDGLRPPALDRGLRAALDVVLRRHRGAGAEVVLTVSGDLARLPAAIEVAAYRVIDEALTNVARHANAATAWVTVAREAGRLHLTVDDDGIGGVAPHADGVGLASMRERCQELGGHLIAGALPRGTRIAASIPID